MVVGKDFHYLSVVFIQLLGVLVTVQFSPLKASLRLSLLFFCALFYGRPCLHSLDPYGFERPHNFDYESYEELMSEYLAVLTRRSIKWSKLLQGKSHIEKSHKSELTCFEVPNKTTCLQTDPFYTAFDKGLISVLRMDNFPPLLNQSWVKIPSSQLYK